MSEFDALIKDIQDWIKKNNNKRDVFYECSDRHVAITLEGGAWISFMQRGENIEVKSSKKYPMGIIFKGRSIEEVKNAL